MQHRAATRLAGGKFEDLRPVVEAPGPFISMVLETDATVENAAWRLIQRWKSVRRDLVAVGASGAVLAHLDGCIIDAHREGQTLFAVANAERCCVIEHGPDLPAREFAWWAPLPILTPVMRKRQFEVPRVEALVDREGADIVRIARNKRRDETIEGEPGVIRKSAPGGWSQKRYQQRAEETWARTAQKVADALAIEVEEIAAELVILAGDVRERSLVLEKLPARVRELVRVIPGGRAEGTSADARARAVREIVAEHVKQQDDALVSRLNEERERSGGAVAGATATLAALDEAKAEILLVHDAVADGPVDTTRIVDVAVRGALTSGAEIRVLPRDDLQVPDGLGAILRWE